MFKVVRPASAPECSKRTGYNTVEIVEILAKIFHEKCYLCEQNSLSDPEIEHLDPHENDESKKFNWHNLYYACSRCNSIKGSTHRNILDCCDSSTEIFKSLRFTLPGFPDDNLRIEATSEYLNEKTINTAILLERCYNDAATGLRGITRSTLIEKIFAHYSDLLQLRITILDVKSASSQIETAKERLAVMFDSSFPFSAIWKWYILNDRKLYEKIKSLVTFHIETRLDSSP